jgi:hypothetical protein
MGNMTSESIADSGAGGPNGWWKLNQASGTTVPDSVCAEARMCANAINDDADPANLDIATVNQ